MLWFCAGWGVVAVTPDGSMPERFVVRRWVDPLVEARGFPVGSVYTETVLLPILGPSSVLCLRRLGSWAASRPGGVEVDSRQLARDLGLGDGLARNSVIARTVGRLCQFGMARWAGGELGVRTVVEPLSQRHLARLSPELVNAHHSMLRRAAVGRGQPLGCQPAPVVEPAAGVQL